MEINRIRDNIILVAVEGLDVSGKETFTNNMSGILRKRLNAMKLKYSLHTVSFPRYASKHGKEIKRLLLMTEKERDSTLNGDKHHIHALCELDRQEYFQELYAKLDKEYDKNTVHIVLADRYVISNGIYTFLENMTSTNREDDDVTTYKFVKRRMNLEFINIPRINVQVIFNRLNVEGEAKHKELLTNKAETDDYEQEYLQDYLADIIKRNMELYKSFSYINYEINIGDTFDNEYYEEVVLSEVIGLINKKYGSFIKNYLDLEGVAIPSDDLYSNNFIIKTRADRTFDVMDIVTSKFEDTVTIKSLIDMKAGRHIIHTGIVLKSDYYNRTMHKMKFRVLTPKNTNILIEPVIYLSKKEIILNCLLKEDFENEPLEIVLDMLRRSNSN